MQKLINFTHKIVQELQELPELAEQMVFEVVSIRCSIGPYSSRFPSRSTFFRRKIAKNLKIDFKKLRKIWE